MGFVEGGDLASFIKAKGEASVPASLTSTMKILCGISDAMAYLHSQDPLPILHRDLKTENILLTSDHNPKVADLGEARTLAREAKMTIVGTRGYTAPEVIMGESCESFEESES